MDAIKIMPENVNYSVPNQVLRDLELLAKLFGDTVAEHNALRKYPGNQAKRLYREHLEAFEKQRRKIVKQLESLDP